MGAWNCWNSLDLRKKARKSKCWLLKVTKRVQNPWSFSKLNVRHLDIFSSGYFHKRNVCCHVVTSLRTCIVQGNRILWRIESKKLGLWLRSSLILLNPCETVLSQGKTMFTRVKTSAEEEIHRSVYGMLCDHELRKATRERMFMLQRDWGSRK